MNDQPIGVFDSGIGGLSIAGAIRQLLPYERLVYVGDTARVPYGSRQPSEIRRFSRQIVYFLLQQKVKMIVVACNTITVTCLKELQDLAPVPVIGVIDPVVEYIARVSAGKVAILATPVTVNSGVYGRKLRQRRADMTVWEKSCPAFVPLIEQGLASSIAAEALVEAALADMPADVDTIQLGCTHYRMLRPAIAAQVQPGVQIVDSAASTAQEVQRVLGYLGQLQQGRELRDEFYFTSLTDRMLKSGRQMFGGDIVANSHKLTLRLLAQSPQMLCSANQCPVRSGQSKV